MILAVLFISFLAAIWVAAPFWKPSNQAANLKTEWMREQNDFLMRSLASAIKDHKRGKISVEDFENIERKMILAIAKIRHQKADANLTGNTCSACHRALEKDSQFCGHCGTDHAPTTTCSECGTKVESDYQFCPKCGHRQANEESA